MTFLKRSITIQCPAVPFCSTTLTNKRTPFSTKVPVQQLSIESLPIISNLTSSSSRIFLNVLMVICVRIGTTQQWFRPPRLKSRHRLDIICHPFVVVGNTTCFCQLHTLIISIFVSPFLPKRNSKFELINHSFYRSIS